MKAKSKQLELWKGIEDTTCQTVLPLSLKKNTMIRDILKYILKNIPVAIIAIMTGAVLLYLEHRTFLFQPPMPTYEVQPVAKETAPDQKTIAFSQGITISSPIPANIILWCSPPNPNLDSNYSFNTDEIEVEAYLDGSTRKSLLIQQDGKLIIDNVPLDTKRINFKCHEKIMVFAFDDYRQMKARHEDIQDYGTNLREWQLDLTKKEFEQ